MPVPRPSDLHLRLLSATGAAAACAAAVVGFASTVPRSGEPASASGFAAAFLLLTGALWITVAGSQANFAVVGLPLWAHWYLATSFADQPARPWWSSLLVVAGVVTVASAIVGAVAFFSVDGRLALVSLATVAVGACVMGFKPDGADDVEFDASAVSVSVGRDLPEFARFSWPALLLVAGLGVGGTLLSRKARRGPMTRALAAAAATFLSGAAAVTAVLSAASGGGVTVVNGAVWWLGIGAASGLMLARTPFVTDVRAATGLLEFANVTWLPLGGIGVLAAFGGGPALAVAAACVLVLWAGYLRTTASPSRSSGTAGRR